jgi:hypothetical protein
VSQATATATGILDFSWSTTGTLSASDPYVGGYGIFQFDDADPFDLQVRESYDPVWQYWGGTAKSFGTTSLESSIASQISDNSTTSYPTAASGQMSATATAIKPDNQTYERAVSSVQLGFVRVSPDLGLDARDTTQTATLGLTFDASSSLTPNSLVTDASAFSNMFFSVAMRVGLLDDEGNLWQVYSFYSENPSDPGSYGATWDINPYSVNMFFSEHPIGASMQSAATGEYIPVPEFDWADYQAVLEKSDLIDDYTGFEISFSVTGYASEYGRAAESLPIDKYWISDTDDRWNIGDNWEPAGEPATGDAIHLETDDGSTRVVTYDTTLADPTFSSLRIDAISGGSITLQQSQDSLGVAGGYTEIGWAGKGTFEQDGGTSTFDTVIVGSKTGSDGSVSLSGGTTTTNRLVVAEQANSTGNVQVHTGGDLTVATDAVIGEGGSGTFVQDGGTSAIATMIVGAKTGSTGSATLSGGTTTVNRLVVAENIGSTGSVGVSGTGALTVSTDAVIGQGGIGSFSLSGGSLTVTGWGTIGVSNNGSFSQTNGTSDFSRVVLGLTSTGIGTFALTGGTSTIGELVLGHDVGSQATFNLSGTGNLVVSGDATVGSGSVGVFNQSGGTADVGSYLFVGRAPSGEGTINLSGGSLFANQLTVGHDSGAAGDVYLSGAGRLSVDSLTLGLSGTGNLLQSGGELAVKDYLHLGQAAAGRGTCTLVDGTSSIGKDVYVGEGPNSSGVFWVKDDPATSPTTVATVGGSIAVGLTSTSSGSLVIDGGELAVAQHVALGTFGTGSAEQTGGKFTVGWSLFLGTNDPDSLGSYEISGGELTVGQQLQVGSVGQGTFVQNGGTVEARTVLVGGGGTLGTYTLIDGTLTAGLNINVGNGALGTGQFYQRAGLVTAGDYLNLGVSANSQGDYFLEGGTLNVGISGTAIGIDGYGLFSHGVGTHTTMGNLIIGSATSGEGLYVIGTGGHLSSVGQYIGNYGKGSFVQNGGSNSASDYMVLGGNASGVGSYDMRDGTLSIAGHEFVGHLGSGQVTQSGGSHTVGGNLVLGSQAGSVGTFAQSGGTLGVGGDITVGAGGRGTYTLLGGDVAATTMTVGGSGGGTGTVNHFGGSLVVDDVVTIGAGSGRGTYFLLGATLTADEVQVGSNGRLLGIGTIEATVVNNGGFIGPGLSPGEIDIVGDFLFNSGVLEIEVAGLGAGQFDVLDVSGNAVFAGGTILFSFIDGFLPKQGDIIPFLLAWAVEGLDLVTFDYVGAAPGFDFKISYEEATNEVVFKALNNAQAVPEPATLALVALGLAGIGAVRRKKLAA